MRLWTAEPRDTLVVRDARREFSGMGPMETVGVPWPSTTAGFVRTRAGLDANGVFKLSPEAARQIEVAGAWLARLDDDGTVEAWLFPAPLDCLFFGTETSGVLDRRRLVPATRPESVESSCTLPLLPRPPRES